MPDAGPSKTYAKANPWVKACPPSEGEGGSTAAGDEGTNGEGDDERTAPFLVSRSQLLVPASLLLVGFGTRFLPVDNDMFSLDFVL